MWKDGVEYTDEKLPAFVLKAMEARWAEDLVAQGRLLLRPLSFYRALEHDELGDRWEGIGKREINGVTVELTTANEVFVFCAAVPERPENLLGLDGAYDTLVRIDDPVAFSGAIVTAAKVAGISLIPQVGSCRYVRGHGTSKAEETTWASAWNVFEKDPKYRQQAEFRFAFYDVTGVDDARGNEESKPQPNSIPLTLADPARFLSIVR